MRAMMLEQPGELPGRMSLAELPRPSPGPGEVLVEVAFAGCNFADTMTRRGTYPHPRSYPMVPGAEISGRIAAIGPGVTGLAAGDRVAATSEKAGGFAEFCLVPAYRVIPLPAAIGLDQGAAFPVQALTAWQMLHVVAKTLPGEVVLVHAIGGGVGLYLTQLAVQAGATVIGTVGTRGKEKRALDLGATLVVNREEEDFVAAIERFMQGRGVDKIIDSTGGSILDRSFALIRQLGHVVSYGEAEGKPYANLWERLVRKSLTFTRFHLGHADYASPDWQRGLDTVLGGIAEGRIQVPIEEVFALEEAAAMYDRLESRQVAGKLLLRVGG
jgi:NADPH2:quinone reductase